MTAECSVHRLDKEYSHMSAVRSINCELVFLELTKADAAFVDLASHEDELDFDTVVSALHAPDCGQSLSGNVRK